MMHGQRNVNPVKGWSVETIATDGN